MKRTLLDKFKNQEQINLYLAHYKKSYRPYDPGGFLYNQLMEMSFDEKFKNIELIYVTLSAWNMNSRGAKLSEFSKFKDSLLKNKALISSLSEYRMGKKGYERLFENIEDIFKRLDLVAKGKPKLVTFSKTLHYLLPHTVAPIDRAYTIKFFTGNTNFTRSKQLSIFTNYHTLFHQLACEIDLNSHLQKKQSGSGWINTNIPKIIDNLIIGYMRKKKIK